MQITSNTSTRLVQRGDKIREILEELKSASDVYIVILLNQIKYLNLTVYNVYLRRGYVISK